MRASLGSRAPFVGLRAYGPDDEGNLYGRATEVERLSRELEAASAERAAVSAFGP